MRYLNIVSFFLFITIIIIIIYMDEPIVRYLPQIYELLSHKLILVLIENISVKRVNVAFISTGLNLQPTLIHNLEQS